MIWKWYNMRHPFEYENKAGRRLQKKTHNLNCLVNKYKKQKKKKQPTIKTITKRFVKDTIESSH